jgi:hypothetical protein
VIELHPILGYACLKGGAPPPPPPPSGGKCAASYPTVCIPPPPPDLNCSDIPWRNFRVLWNVADPDPHHFHGDYDGIGARRNWGPARTGRLTLRPAQDLCASSAGTEKDGRGRPGDLPRHLPFFLLPTETPAAPALVAVGACRQTGHIEPRS